MTGRFLQIHTLTSYPAALLNRDDVGFAKRMPFGGATRTRISSQCLKRHWRTHDGSMAIAGIEIDGTGVPMAIRSRRTFERYVFGPLVESGVDEELALAITQALMEQVLGQSARAAKKADEDKGEGARTGQVTVLGRPEIDFLLEVAKDLSAEVKAPKQAKAAVQAAFKGAAKKNIQALQHAAGLDAALFGRMITSDILARSDASVHVAHAMTVHAEESETDYFSALDDLLATADDEQLGSGHIGTTELTSGLYYGYVVVDVPLLVSNLEGTPRSEWQTADRSLTGEVVARLIQLIATVSPGAKLGSTAPYSRAHLLMVEAGDTQPRTLSNAFLAPVATRPDVVANAYSALAGHLGELDSMYGVETERSLAAIGPKDLLTGVVPVESHRDVPGLVEWTRAAIGAS